MVLLAQLIALIKRHPVTFACGLLAVALGVANWFLWEHRIGSATLHEDVRRRGEAMLEALTERNQLNADLGVVRGALGVIEENLVTEEGMEVNLGYFYRLEKANRVRLSRIDQMVAQPPDKGSPFKSVPVSLQVTGSYRNILGFLREIETGPRILRIRNYRFERLATGDNELVVFITVELLAKA